ncbi:rhodanese-like domain-containing protein [Shewanella sp. VB17]|nr:rhodanese-like domain-containing protein [Shewanella sp. VB17]
MISAVTIAADKSPETIEGATTVDTVKAKELFDQSVLFVDMRSSKDWDSGRIPDAEYLELKTKFTEANLSAELGKDEPVVMYCNGHNCLRSSKAAAQAVSWGFTKVYYYRDGYPAWKAAGYPTE